MLDPDEVADFETWKQAKLNGIHDLSVSAYNTEMEALALAWEAGAKTAHEFRDADITSILAKNPHRKPGMKGERRATARVSGNPQPIEPSED